MGGSNTKSSSEFGQIHLSLTEPSFFQGTYATGSIYLNLLSNFPKSEIFFKIKGKEDCSWSEGSGKHRRYYHGKKVIISNQFSVMNFPSAVIPAGQYTFPISLFLSPTLPASFEHEYTNSKIIFKIKAELRGAGGQKGLKVSTPLIIKQGYNPDFAPMTNQLSVAVDSCCCCNEGTTNFSTKVNKTSFVEGETAILECSVDNSKCNLRLRSITLRFLQNMTRTSNSGHVNVYSQVLSSQTNAVNVPEKSSGPPSTVHFEMLLKRDNNQKIHTSTFGTLVKNQYFLSITTNYDGFWCNCCVKPVETPILLYEPANNFLQPAIQAPANWNPQTMPVQQLEWGRSQTYMGKNSGGYEYPVLDMAKMSEPLMPQNINISNPESPNPNMPLNNPGYTQSDQYQQQYYGNNDAQNQRL